MAARLGFVWYDGTFAVLLNRMDERCVAQARRYSPGTGQLHRAKDRYEEFRGGDRTRN